MLPILQRVKEFPLGNLRATRTVMQALGPERLFSLFRRHAAGDWGTLDAEDWSANDAALGDGTRLLSAYPQDDGRKVYLITEADRSHTTALFADEY
jgi:hypothetical protein